MSSKTILSILLIIFMQSLVFGQQYAEVMKQSLIKSDKEFEQFSWVTYPTNNNGVLSMGKSKKAKYSLKDHRCPTFTCLGLPETLIDDPNGIKINNMVTLNTGESGVLNDALTKKSLIDATLPHFLNIIGININSDRKKVVEFNFTFGSLTRREILPAELIGYLESIQNNQNATLTQKSIYSLYKQRLLSVISKDIVIEKMSFFIKINSENNFGIQAELNQKTGKIFGQDSTLKVGVSRIDNTTYKLETTRPLVIARFYQTVKDFRD